MRLMMKRVRIFHTQGVLPHSLRRARTVSMVSSEVRSSLATSTRGMMEGRKPVGGGSRAARPPGISVKGLSEEVLETKMASGGSRGSTWAKTEVLMAGFSATVS